MVAHFDLPAPCDPSVLCRQLAAALPPDVVVHALTQVDDEFHARYGARRRTYVYRIMTEATPFGRDRRWLITGALDPDRLREAAAAVCGEHDFSGFCRAESRKDDNRCRVAISRWEREGALLLYRVTADRFLHQMVRLLVGTFVDVARGRLSPERVVEILQSGDVRLCGMAAPPHGLTLERVSYARDDADDLG
jgi:tRNA pseudouridine38-40 synthase